MTNTPFASEGAAPKSTLICIGQLTTIGEVANNNGSERGKEDYYKITYKLSGNGDRDQVGTFLFTPEFFEPTYNPRKDQSKSHRFVYSNNIWREEVANFNLLASPNANTQRVGLPTLPGLCGSQEKFVEVGSALQNAFCTTQDAGKFARLVQDTLTELAEDENHQIGYVLKQQFSGTGRYNERGYEEKIPGKYYEIVGFFYPTEDTVQMLEKKVEKFNSSEKTGGYRAAMTFSLETPFSAAGAAND